MSHRKGTNLHKPQLPEACCAERGSRKGPRRFQIVYIGVAIQRAIEGSKSSDVLAQAQTEFREVLDKTEKWPGDEGRSLRVGVLRVWQECLYFLISLGKDRVRRRVEERVRHCYLGRLHRSLEPGLPGPPIGKRKLPLIRAFFQIDFTC